jgi:hypothetical protein
MVDLPSAYPLRDLFDAALRGRSVRLSVAMSHRAIFSSHALWWLFHRKDWRDRFEDVRKRCLCLLCLHWRGEKVRSPEFELVHQEPTDISLTNQGGSEMDWKRELRRRH